MRSEFLEPNKSRRFVLNLLKLISLYSTVKPNILTLALLSVPCRPSKVYVLHVVSTFCDSRKLIDDNPFHFVTVEDSAIQYWQDQNDLELCWITRLADDSDDARGNAAQL